MLEAQGSVLTNKYAEGYPGKRYYGGCEYVDVAEDLARDRVKALFGAALRERPAALRRAGQRRRDARADQRPGDTILGLELAHGGHLTHGMKINFSGRLYDVAAYGVDPQSFRIDMDVVREKALEHRPQLIIAGWSAYPRQLDFAAFRSIADEVGALLLVDMAHFAGLVAAGPAPEPGAARARRRPRRRTRRSRGPRGGMILAGTTEHDKKFQSAVFPGQQGGPLMHVIAAKAASFKVAGLDGVHRAAGAHAARREDPRRAADARPTPRRPASPCSPAAPTSTSCSSTCASRVLDGQQAEDRLHEVGITVNRNAVPFDPRPPMVTSGLRIGTPALATRGFGDAEFTEVADVIALALQPDADVEALRARVDEARRGVPAVPGPRAVVTAVEAHRGGNRADPRRQGDARPHQGRAGRAGRGAARPAASCPVSARVLVGDDPGSAACTSRRKHRDCAEVGIAEHPGRPAGRRDAGGRRGRRRAGSTTDPACTGYIVQLPLPAGLDADRVLELIDPAKDADGLHPTNLGRLVLNVNEPMTSPLPCTPRGIVELLLRHDVDLAGAEVCVLGRGITVGRPLGLLLTRRAVNATVTLCHTGTRDLAAHVRRADVVVAAAGVPGIVTADMVKPGAVVLDVGVSRVLDPDGGKAELVGDVAPDVRRGRGLGAPNPGGVGPDDPGDAADERGGGGGARAGG